MVATHRIRQLQKDVNESEEAELRRLEGGAMAGGDGDRLDVPETGGGASGGQPSRSEQQESEDSGTCWRGRGRCKTARRAARREAIHQRRLPRQPEDHRLAATRICGLEWLFGRLSEEETVGDITSGIIFIAWRCLYAELVHSKVEKVPVSLTAAVARVWQMVITRLKAEGRRI